MTRRTAVMNRGPRGGGGLSCRLASQLADPSLRNAQQHGGIADRKLRSEATQELGGVAGDLRGGALLLATTSAQPAGPLVKHRTAPADAHERPVRPGLPLPALDRWAMHAVIVTEMGARAQNSRTKASQASGDKTKPARPVG